MPKIIVIISSNITHFSIKFQDIVQKITEYYLYCQETVVTKVSTTCKL